MAAAPKIAGCILRLFDEQLMPDTSIIAGGKEIRAHKAILVATSGYFREWFKRPELKEPYEIPVKENYKAVRALIRFLYFGQLQESDLGPEDGLDLLGISRDYGIDVMADDDVVDLIVPQLTLENCLPVLLHPELGNHSHIIEGVCNFVGKNFFKLTAKSTARMQLLTIDRKYFLEVLKVICKYCADPNAAESVVQFTLEKAHIDNACDLLRDCKQWPWNDKLDMLTKLRNPNEAAKVSEVGGGISLKADMSEEEIFEMLDVNKDGVVSREEFNQLKKTMATISSYSYYDEWTIPNIKAALNGEPLCSLVCGEFFEWRVRVDNGAEGRLRIVYEDVLPRHAGAACCRRFPAATFAWKVKFRGEEIFNDRPVFITFAERVSLHWSTTLGLDSTLLTDDDSLTISCVMTENPLLSLVLYFLSSNVKNEAYAEDILNRLPHIEYRCLSSFFIFRQSSRPGSASNAVTQEVPAS